MKLINALSEMLDHTEHLKYDEIKYIQNLKDKVSNLTAESRMAQYGYFSALYERYKIRRDKLPLEINEIKNYTANDLISYREMCQIENDKKLINMHFRPTEKYSVFIMSVVANYQDKVTKTFIIYDGMKNQPERNSVGELLENGKFHELAQDYRKKGVSPEPVMIYWKVEERDERNKGKIWLPLGIYKLVDSVKESDGLIVPRFIFILEASK